MKQGLLVIAGALAALALVSFRSRPGAVVREEYRIVSTFSVKQRALKELVEAKLLEPGAVGDHVLVDTVWLALLDEKVARAYVSSLESWLGTMSEEGWSLVLIDDSNGGCGYLFRRPKV